jgi:ABC-type branched-subunit amino acid transport system ATPase component
MFMKANGEMIKHMDRVFTTIMMVQATMDSGLRMSKRDLALRNGPMDLHIKGNCLVYA